MGEVLVNVDEVLVSVCEVLVSLLVMYLLVCSPWEQSG